MPSGGNELDQLGESHPKPLRYGGAYSTIFQIDLCTEYAVRGCSRFGMLNLPLWQILRIPEYAPPPSPPTLTPDSAPGEAHSGSQLGHRLALPGSLVAALGAGIYFP